VQIQPHQAVAALLAGPPMWPRCRKEVFDRVRPPVCESWGPTAEAAGGLSRRPWRWSLGNTFCSSYLLPSAW